MWEREERTEHKQEGNVTSHSYLIYYSNWIYNINRRMCAHSKLIGAINGSLFVFSHVSPPAAAVLICFSRSTVSFSLSVTENKRVSVRLPVTHSWKNAHPKPKFSSYSCRSVHHETGLVWQFWKTHLKNFTAISQIRAGLAFGVSAPRNVAEFGVQKGVPHCDAL